MSVLVAALSVLVQSTPLDTEFMEDRSVELAVRREVYGIRARRSRDAEDYVEDRLDRGQWASTRRFHVSAEAYFAEERGTCSLDGVFVSAEAVVELPYWTGLPDASDRATGRWNAFFSGIVDHESAHLDIAMAGLTRIRDDLEALPPAGTCEDLDASIQSTVRDGRDWIDRNQRDYDDVTGHGQNEVAGAAWQPLED